jgi:CRISPR-associated protein Cmr2
VKYFEKHELGDVAISNLSNIKNSNKEIKRYLKSIHLSFSSYYAILAFDGDKMGEHLSGIFLADKSKLEEFHYKLSESLGHFAKESKKYLDLNFGQTIYAGGDDFLGFVNLSNLFSVLENIHSLFEEYVNKPLLNYFQNNKMNNIVHYHHYHH